MSDIIATGVSEYATGSLDTASLVEPNVTPLSYRHPNGCASAIVQIETVLGSATALKGGLADLATRLAVQMTSAGIIIPVGTFFPYGGTTAPSGYLLAGSDYNRTTYATLFGIVSTRFGIGNGSTTFGLHLDGRTVIAAGTPVQTVSGLNNDVDTTGDTLAVAANNTTWITGMPVVLTISSGTITGLTSGVTYYLIRNSSTTVKLATTLALAQNGTAIDMTAKSSPVWTLTYTGTARTIGETGGEDAHAMSGSELLAHTHTGPEAGFFVDAGASFALSTGGVATHSIVAATNSTGGNAAMNIHTPYIVSNYIFKY